MLVEEVRAGWHFNLHVIQLRIGESDEYYLLREDLMIMKEMIRI
jgi:hypothetical protein